MKRRRPAPWLLLSLPLGAALAPGVPVRADEPSRIEVREWRVPWVDTRPRDPFVREAGTVWFVGQVGGYLARLDADSGAFHRVDLDEGAGPHNLIVAPDGVVWFAGNRYGYIGRYDPAADALEKVALPPEAPDPHTLVLGPQGRIWFTVQGGNRVGRLDPQTREVHLVDVPTAGARPYGIVIARDGTPWVALFGTHKLASVDPETLELRQHLLPDPEARPRRIGATSDGRLWYGDYARGTLGVHDPDADAQAGRFREWALPGGAEARPYALAVDDRDRVWVAETGPDPNRLVAFDTASETFISTTPVPSGAGSIRNMHYHAPTQTLWFGTDAGTIGRAKLE